MNDKINPPNNERDFKQYKVFSSLPWLSQLKKLYYCRRRGINRDNISDFLFISNERSQTILSELCEYKVLEREESATMSYRYRFTDLFCEFLESNGGE